MVDLRGPAPKVGQVVAETARFEAKNLDMTIKINGQVIPLKVEIIEEGEEEYTIKGVDGYNLTRFETKLLKSEGTFTTTDPGGGREVDEEVGDLAGATILSEKVGGKWKHSLVGRDPDTNQKKALDEMNGRGRDQDLNIPSSKQKVGASWFVNSSHMENLLGENFSSISGKVRATFARLERFDGELCAVIECKGTVKARVVYEDDKIFLATIELNEVIYHSLKTGLDVKDNANLDMRMTAKVKAPEGDSDVEIKGRGVIAYRTTIKEE